MSQTCELPLTRVFSCLCIHSRVSVHCWDESDPVPGLGAPGCDEEDRTETYKYQHAVSS